MYYNLSEFSKLYKRLMFFEYCLKDRLVRKYTIVHGNKCFKRILPYLKKLEVATSKYKNKFSKLDSNTQKSAADKLIEAFDILYLADVVDLLNEAIFYKDLVSKNFFKFTYVLNDFKSHCKNIKEFRNTISHLNFKAYSTAKHSYIKSLVYFEDMLELKLYGVDINKFSLSANRPCASEIMKFIYKEDKNLISDDMKVIDIFDEIAISNGYTVKSLPSRASVIRTMFKIKAENKKSENISQNDKVLK